MHRIDKDVFNSVKKTFTRIGFSSGDRKQHQEPLIFMNVPAIMARRDSAYDRAIHLLCEHIFTLKERERRDIYEAVLKLLGVAIDATQAIVIGTREKIEADPILQYLRILFDTVNAAFALVKHEMVLFKDEKSMASFIGNKITSQFITAEEIFSNSEMNIFHSINDLIDIAESAIARNREFRKKSFSKSDLKRYNKALAEFGMLYGKLGRLSPPEVLDETKPT